MLRPSAVTEVEVPLIRIRRQRGKIHRDQADWLTVGMRCSGSPGTGGAAMRKVVFPAARKPGCRSTAIPKQGVFVATGKRREVTCGQELDGPPSRLGEPSTPTSRRGLLTDSGPPLHGDLPG